MRVIREGVRRGEDDDLRSLPPHGALIATLNFFDSKHFTSSTTDAESCERQGDRRRRKRGSVWERERKGKGERAEECGE